ncbi:hypothetical protein HanRHA438_Chr15g0717851 [Helianthus annuus]|nr:hypothetical protein HanIR_Chr15g0767421 [Helianthus annuus]KAJ0845810.1 hypothetical protein HanRHA438_Chr15g0717851 [Helianthus annuus]
MLERLHARFRVGSIMIQFSLTDSFRCLSVAASAPAISSTVKSMGRAILNGSDPVPAPGRIRVGSF